MLGFQFIFKRYRLSWIVISGVLVNIAAVIKRFLIVVPSQTHGTLLPYGVGSYSPTWVEYSIILGLLAMGTLFFVLFIKVFPFTEVPGTLVGGD
jgi:molybdopterin-containing oxidoreductase family membrane subunit